MLKGIPLKDINFILLDMDGTLLDLYFDDYFWGHLVPEKYAERHDMTFGAAKDYLYQTYKSHEKTLNWCDIDFWSKELRLDIPALKEQIRHLIEVHPHVIDFLKLMRRKKKKIFLLTNAHYKTVKLKFRKTQIGEYFDEVLCSFNVGHPKEFVEFWHGAEKRLKFDKERSLFIDDTEDVLKTAKGFGVKYLLFKARASSKTEPKKTKEFLTIHDFRELM
ncbi:MAG: HAD-IA family hydrolase [Thermodesulfovibrionia bacterium]|nr:HAD-IA family hydrolase [Thermodesulfovibrionia bacterium]